MDLELQVWNFTGRVSLRQYQQGHMLSGQVSARVVGRRYEGTHCDALDEPPNPTALEEKRRQARNPGSPPGGESPDHGGWWRSDGKALGGTDFATATSSAYQEAGQSGFFSNTSRGRGGPGRPGRGFLRPAPTAGARFPADPRLRRGPPTRWPQPNLSATRPVPYTRETSSRFGSRRPV